MYDHSYLTDEDLRLREGMGFAPRELGLAGQA